MGNVHMEATQINYRGGSKKMSVEEAIKAAGTEITPEEKTWIDSIPTLASGKADNDVIAPEFDSEAGVYAIGDLVMHEGKLYEFTTAHETTGEWDSTEVTEKTVADELDSVKSGLTNVTRLAHEDYIDVYQVGVTVHIYLRSNGTYTPNDTNTLVSNMPLPKGLLTIFNGMSYYDGASKTGIIHIDQSGDIKIMDNGGNPITHVNYLSGELVYLVN